MYKTLLLFVVILTSIFSLHAQCEGCVLPEGFEADYCFTHNTMPGYCAQFKLGDDSFYFQKKEGREGMKLMLQGSMDMEDLFAFFGDKANQIKKANESLFILKALESWNMKKKTLVADQAAEQVFSEAALQALEFEQKYPSGLKIHIVNQGEGPLPKKGQNVSVHYRGYLLNGKVFDESYKRGQPIAFPLGMGRVIKGWDEAISTLNMGTRALIYLPAEIAYGERGAGGDIPPGATLVFDVVLMDIQ
ncbi:MAG: FKBP-type peptidyl-prolyl cis-trans isomerase [Bacteroidia bacterium]